MDQELKQRLIGAAVITALAAIFVPMLFDDPIDETGKSINELKIPELPVKAQDVEIMPLPEKVEEVATVEPLEKPSAPTAAYEGDEEEGMEAPKPLVHIDAKDTTPAPTRYVEPVSEEDDVAVSPKPVPDEPVVKPVKPIPQPPVKVEKVAKTPAPEPAKKPAIAAESAATRLYLNAGTFSQQSNAISLQDSLKKQGFAASIKEVATEKGKVYKVRVGPMLDKAQAQATKSKLSQINVNSFVTGDD